MQRVPQPDEEAKVVETLLITAAALVLSLLVGALAAPKPPRNDRRRGLRN
jgi:hypothetical protein